MTTAPPAASGFPDAGCEAGRFAVHIAAAGVYARRAEDTLYPPRRHQWNSPASSRRSPAC
jgi:hypothetical protein